MSKVEVGQVWEVNKEPAGRCRFRVTAIDGGTAHVVFERSGRVGVATIRNMCKGLRGARLIATADGSAPQTRPGSARVRELASHPDHVDDDGPVIVLTRR